VDNSSYTEKQFRCNGCGKMFFNSQLVKRRLQTGHSGKKKYYNDRLVCTRCASNHDILSLVGAAIFLAIFIPFCFGVFQGLSNRTSNQNINNSIQNQK
jgi:hypothetical protein